MNTVTTEIAVFKLVMRTWISFSAVNICELMSCLELERYDDWLVWQGRKILNKRSRYMKGASQKVESEIGNDERIQFLLPNRTLTVLFNKKIC